MIKSPDEALAKFNDVCGQVWHELSETDTRCKIIDPLFKECLNWNEEDIVREEHSDSGYVDYLFYHEKRPLFVIEAKREGISFTIPDNFKNRIYKIDGVISHCEELIAAIKQAQQYCIDHGVRVGIVTNGHQYLVFEAFRTGSSWKEGKCIIYRSFHDIALNFGSFWDLLNKNSVSAGSLIIALSDKIEDRVFTRPLDKIHNKEEKLTRNYLNEYLSPFVDHIFGEITDPSQLDILDSCYVYEKAYGASDQEIRSYFVDRLPHFAKSHNIKLFTEESSDAGIFTVDFEKCQTYVKSQTTKGSMLLLLGGIGAGKTTFLHRFFNIILKDKPKLLWFYIDCRKSPINDAEIEAYIYSKIIDQFEEKYKPAIQDELDKVLLGIDKKNPVEYVDNVFALLRCLSYSVALVVDNIDQHKTELQESIFLATEHITDELRTITILALREESYYRSTLKGALDASDKKKFHISSPQFELVVASRVQYLMKLLKMPVDDIKHILQTSIAIEEKIKDIIDFFEIVNASIQRKTEDRTSPIAFFITQISSGNMRVALNMFNTYLISGNTKVEEMLYKYRDDGYQIAMFQFFKSIILGESRYYLGDKSFIMNLFEPNLPYSDSHFLNIRILNYAYHNRSNDTPAGRGYVEINRVKQEAEDLLINSKAIEESLVMLAKFDLISFETQSKKDVLAASYFCITSTGSYYLTQLTQHFIYLDLISGDTPISDINVVHQIKQLLDSTDMNLRFKKTDIYLGYLRECEDIEFSQTPEYQESSLTKTHFIGDIAAKFQYEKKVISQKIENKKHRYD